MAQACRIPHVAAPLFQNSGTHAVTHGAVDFGPWCPLATAPFFVSPLPGGAMSDATVPVSRYRYRRSTCEVVNWTIDREAMAFVRQCCPSGTKMISRYITRL